MISSEKRSIGMLPQIVACEKSMMLIQLVNAMILTSTKNSIPVPPIEFRNVSMKFGEKTALANISFKLEDGQMIVLTGTSSSGKSVLLHLAIGLLQPTDGEILIQGRSLQSLEEHELLRMRSAAMGMVFQADTLMLFDEPTSGLDPINGRRVLDLMIRARDTHMISSLCATKEMSDISYLAHRYAREDETGVSIVTGAAPPECQFTVIVLEEGKLSFLGTESEFQSSQTPSVVTLTGCQMNTGAGPRELYTPRLRIGY